MRASLNQADELLNIILKDVQLQGFLRIPKDAKGIVIFAHGSGSSRFSHRNRAVADYLFQRNMGTLLFDLLTNDEEEKDQLSAVYRFNILFLSERLGEVTETLLIVGGNDTDVLRLNREAYHYIHASKDLYIVKGATHLFEEPGALEEVAHRAAQWFEKYFTLTRPKAN